jgi:hypothetical protein
MACQHILPFGIYAIVRPSDTRDMASDKSRVWCIIALIACQGPDKLTISYELLMADTS